MKSVTRASHPKKPGSRWMRFKSFLPLYLMLVPGMLYFIIFKYLPMAGVSISFMDYYPFLGFMGSKWVGLKHFQRLFSEPLLWQLLGNTIILALYNIILFFPLPIILALLINEVRGKKFKSTVQSVLYLPHFISWVVVAGICYNLFSPTAGAITKLLNGFGLEAPNILGEASWFRPLITGQVIWKESGWGTIIFLAALAGVDVSLYEAADLDGATRLQKIWHITLPAIRSTIIIMLILRLGSFMDSGFEQIYLMLNSTNREVGEVFDTYVYTAALINGQFSYSTAVGLFKSVINMVLVLGANQLAKFFGEEGVY